LQEFFFSLPKIFSGKIKLFHFHFILQGHNTTKKKEKEKRK